MLQHFKQHLAAEPESVSPNNGAKATPLVYVKKWLRTHHAIIFRLSNKVVQVIFTDRTEVLLSSGTREVMYVNKKGERLNYPLDSAFDSENAEMIKRLKYTKDILAKMLSAHKGEAAGRLRAYFCR